MKYLKPTIWLLLVYWIPLMNLGPSLHHADVFGLHTSCCNSGCCASSSGSSFEARSQELDYFGCDGQCQGQCQNQRASNPTQDADQCPDIFAGTTTDVCLFCEFFKKYNVVFSCFHFPNPPQRSVYRMTLADIFESQDAILGSARGPPVSAVA